MATVQEVARKKQKKGREEEEPDEGTKERKIRSEITQEVLAGIKREASAQEDANSIAHRTVGQDVHAKLGQFAYRKRRRGGKLARRRADGSTVG